MKIAKSAFWGQNSGGVGGGQVNVSGSGGISSSPSPPTVETLSVAIIF